MLVTGVALAGAACGGGASDSATGTDAGAAVVPASAAGYLGVDTDLDSDQWQRAAELARAFPGRDRAIASILEELGEEGVDWQRDVRPALGPEVAVAFLVEGSRTHVVALTKPNDEDKLRALLAKGDSRAVTRELDGWTLLAEKQADLDAFERGRDAGKLADDGLFQEATADLPDEALATFYVNGDAAQKALARSGSLPTGALGAGGRPRWVGGAVEALDDGFRMSGRAKIEGQKGGEPYSPELVDRVPADALAVASFNGADESLTQLRSHPFAREAIPQIEQTLGVTLGELAELFRDEGVLYVRPGLPVPEVTLVLDVDAREKALRTVDRLARRVAGFANGRTGTRRIDGVATSFLDIRGVRVSYAVVDGRLVITSGVDGIGDFRGDDEKFADDDGFARAKEAAGLGDETSGFLYVDVADAFALLRGFASMAGESIPEEATANVAPLESLLVHSSRDGDEVEFGAYLRISG